MTHLEVVRLRPGNLLRLRVGGASLLVFEKGRTWITMIDNAAAGERQWSDAAEGSLSMPVNDLGWWCDVVMLCALPSWPLVPSQPPIRPIGYRGPNYRKPNRLRLSAWAAA
jgi:hypothetical protein